MADYKPFNDIGMLPNIPMSDANATALELIDGERSGEQLGLYSRFGNMNRGFGKYFRFGLNTLIGGLSGSGKSTLLNLLIQDFTSVKDYTLEYENASGEKKSYTMPAINSAYNNTHIHVHFAFEMSSHNEVLRMVSSQSGLSYNELLSSKHIGNNEFERLSDAKYDMVKRLMTVNSSRPLIFVEATGNAYEIYNTVYHIYNHYAQKGYKTISISVDHTLLTDKLNERSAMEMIGNLAKVAIKIRKDFKAHTFWINQLNGKIQSIERRVNPQHHPPIEEDIYGSKEIVFAMDNCMILHNPQKVGIVQYTTERYDGRDCLHGVVFKQRFGSTGSLWFQKEFAKTNIKEYVEGKPPVYEDNALPMV